MRKRTSHRPSFSDLVSGASRRVRKEASRGQYQLDRALSEALVLLVGMMSSMPFAHLAFGMGPTLYMLLLTPIWGPKVMLSSPLGRHILDYKPPREFSMHAFSMFNVSTNPYDHKLYYNQAMILNDGNDCLLCKVFPASWRGPTLARFHKLPHNSIISFNDLWVAFVS